MLREHYSKSLGSICAILVFSFMMQPLDAQGDLSGQDINEDDSSKDMMEHDPNILNPINQEGYGRNVPTTVGDTLGMLFSLSP